jgi:hypothetical protein
METSLYAYFTNDHERLDFFLSHSVQKDGKINLSMYHQFRTGIFKHIKMEEKILFPAAMLADKSKMQNYIPQFRLEHGAITALLVPPPTKEIITVLHYILTKHNYEEEKHQGLYNLCEALTKGRHAELIEMLNNTGDVPVHPNNNIPLAIEAAKRSVARAGYDFDTIVRGNFSN